MNIYLVFEYKAQISFFPEGRALSATDFVGCFDNVDDAIKACRTSTHFYHKVEMNKDYGDAIEFIEVVYPKVKAT